jgi:hypothetical protein
MGELHHVLANVRIIHDEVIKNRKPFQFRVTYYDHDGNIMKSEIQEVPNDGECHVSKVVEENP